MASDIALQSGIRKDLIKSTLYLPLAIDECVYLRGCLRHYTKRLRNGDERDYLLRVLLELETLMSSSSYFSDNVF